MSNRVFKRFPSLITTRKTVRRVNRYNEGISRGPRRFGDYYGGVLSFYSKGGAAGGGGFYTTEQAKQLMRDNRKMGMRKTSFTMRRRNTP